MSLYVERLGATGFPLVILHGWGRSLEALKPLGHLLASSSSVHLVDLPGFGGSEAPDRVWDGYDYANRLMGYLDEQGIEQADFLGHSFGGKVAMCAAIRYPHRVHKLVLMASAGLRRRRTFLQRGRFYTLKGLAKAVKMLDAIGGTRFFTEYFVPRFGSSDYKQAGVMRSILVKSVNEDLSHSLEEIKAPTLILWGNQDTETPTEMAERLQKSIQGSSCFLFPGKGHELFEDTGSHLCAHYIIPFLTNSFERIG